MTTLTIKNVPEGLYARLLKLASINKRSIDHEIIACIEHRVSMSEFFDVEMKTERLLLPTFGGDGLQDGMNLDKTTLLYDLMDETDGFV